MKALLALPLALLLAGVCLASPCGYTCKPAAKTYAPAKTYGRTASYYPTEIVVADAAFLVFDYAAKDVFYFLGPPPAVQPGLTLGVAANGTEVRGVPVAPAPQAVQNAQEDALSDDRPLVGYGRREAVAPRLASLVAGCAGCHTAPKVKGGFTLFAASGGFAAGVDWKAVRDAIVPDRAGRVRMPPASSGKLAVTVADREEVRRLAGS